MRARIAAGLPFVVLLGVHGVAHSAPKHPIDAPHLKPGQMVELQGGVKISKEQYLKELNHLQEALETDNLSFHKAHGRTQTGKLYTHPQAVAEHARDKATIAQKVQLLQGHEARGFSHILVRKGVRPKVGLGLSPTLDSGERATPPPPAGEHAANPSAPAKSPSDDDDPLHVTFEETLGSKNRAAIYVGLALKDTGDTSTLGCDASLDGGIYLFDQKRQLVKVGASGRVVNSQLSGSLDLYLAGKAVDGYPKKGSATATYAKAIQSPSAGYTYGWGPLSISITGAIGGEFKLNASNTQEAPGGAGGGGGAKSAAGGAKVVVATVSTTGGPSGPAPAAVGPHAGKCTLGVTPTVRANGSVTATVSAVLYRAKVKGSIVFLDVGSPSNTAVVARPPKLVEDFESRVDASFLSGEVALQIDTRIPQNWHDGFDWDKVYSKTLFDWDGLKVNQKLASFHGKTTNL